MAAPAKKPTTTTPSDRGPEKLKIAYTIVSDTEVQVVVFGTDADRTAFLEPKQDEWWRITSLHKGDPLVIGINK